MDRSFFAVLTGILSVILFTVIAGLTFISIEIAMWLPFAGFILCCLIIGAVGTYRVKYLVLYSLFIYLVFMVFLSANASLWVSVMFGPLSFGQIQQAWTLFQESVNTIPFIPVLSNIASSLRITLGESLLAVFIEFVVASAFVGFIGLLLTGISGRLTRSEPLHVVTAPEPSVDIGEPSFPATPEPVPPTAMEAPPPMPAPRPLEEASPPPPPLPSKGGAPSAQAISSLKGKVTKHLKGTGQKAPVGQSRCPHCNATVIRGSRFCNACERDI